MEPSGHAAVPDPVPDPVVDENVLREGPTIRDLKQIQQFVTLLPVKFGYTGISRSALPKAWDAEAPNPNDDEILPLGTFPSEQAAAWASDLMKIKMLLCGWRYQPPLLQDKAPLGIGGLPLRFRFFLNFNLQSYLEDLQQPEVAAITDWKQFQQYLHKGKFRQRDDWPSPGQPIPTNPWDGIFLNRNYSGPGWEAD